MPEGDTIHRSAERLRTALQGQELVRFGAARTPKPWPRAGERIEVVSARGKHLLVGFSGGLTLRTHLRMSGSWHLYRPGERWQRAAHRARAVVEVAEWVAVCFDAPVVELRAADAPGPDPTAHLGPDLSVRGADVDACVRRMDELLPASTPAKVALLDQRVACGVGNVFASEVAFVERLHPATPIGALDRSARHRLIATANRLLVDSLAEGRRATLDGRLAVYGRAGRPCPRCATPVRSARLGEHARPTYWCPSCQPARRAA